MALKATFNLKTYQADTAAEIANRVFASNELVTALDTGVSKKGDGVTKFSLLPDFGGGGGGGSVAWADIADKPVAFAPEIGTTATTALAGNTTPATLGAATAAQGTLATNAVPKSQVPTASLRGGVFLATAQAASVATDVAGLVTDFNALLVKLRTAGVIAP